MPDSKSTSQPNQPPPGMTPEKYARLRAEAKAPYKGLRQVIYATAGASGGIGAFIMLTQLLAGKPVGTVLPNLMIQLGVLAVVVVLFRLERRG